MGKKNKSGADIIGKIPKGVWLLISFVVAILVWTLLSVTPRQLDAFQMPSRFWSLLDLWWKEKFCCRILQAV